MMMKEEQNARTVATEISRLWRRAGRMNPTDRRYVQGAYDRLGVEFDQALAKLSVFTGETVTRDDVVHPDDPATCHCGQRPSVHQATGGFAENPASVGCECGLMVNATYEGWTEESAITAWNKLQAKLLFCSSQQKGLGE